MKTSVLIDHEPVADGGFLVRLLLRIEGEQPEDRERIPLNLSLVLDRSGSMAGPKLAAARDAAAMLVQRLWLEDVVSVVAYDDQVEVIAVPASGKDRENTSELIGGIRCGGTTNLSGGWLRARDLVADGLVEGGVNRVLMLTDGHANVGITDPNTLVGLCRAGQEAGITTTTIGFGIEFDEQLLSDMADAGGGATYYIEEIEQAAGVFEEELEGLLSLSAQNVRVTVEPGADADFLQVLHQYPSHAEGEKLTLEVGDLYTREPRLVLICGHYEGFDERIRSGIDAREISIGDYVLSGGAPAAMVLIDAVVRLLPGALGDEASAANDSFSAGLLEYPQYTRPREFRGMTVPEVLLSGDHAKVALWRKEQALKRTLQRRPDLIHAGEA